MMGGPTFKTIEPIFPSDQRDRMGTGPIYSGMTLRDYFAAKAMAALLSTPEAFDAPVLGIARAAYEQADAMLTQRATPGAAIANAKEVL